MDPLQFVHGLQLADSFFPVGAFTYSDGLETAAASGRVGGAEFLGAWMEHFIDGVFVPCEGLALVQSIVALKAGATGRLIHIDEELTAIRPASAVRSASSGVGKRLLSLYAAICGDERFPDYVRMLPQSNAAVAYGLVFFHRGIGERDAAMAFAYNRLAGIVSAGLRLMTIGQQQGQMLLTKAIGRLPAAVDRIVEMTNEPLRSFNPVLDRYQMNHQYLYSRLFRS
jgi:urease accessory protein